MNMKPEPDQVARLLFEVRRELQSLVTPTWPAMPAILEKTESQDGRSRFVLSFLGWWIRVQLEPSPQGGVLLSVSMTPQGPLRRAMSLLAEPVEYGWTDVSRQVIRHARETGPALESAGWTIRRRPPVARALAQRWRERGLRVG